MPSCRLARMLAMAMPYVLCMCAANAWAGTTCSVACRKQGQQAEEGISTELGSKHGVKLRMNCMKPFVQLVSDVDA